MNRTTPEIARHSDALFRWPLGVLVIYLFSVTVAAAQDPSMPGMQMQHQHVHGASPSIEVDFPRLGRDQASAKGSLLSLESALQTARENNPTLRQAEAGVKAAQSRAHQAGLYPNPIVGYSGDEIRGGEIHGGKQGVFFGQNIFTPGKTPRVRAVMKKKT